jgi:hypothetical protein
MNTGGKQNCKLAKFNLHESMLIPENQQLPNLCAIFSPKQNAPATIIFATC